jgi:pyruvate formate lyase activating enzyme
MQGTIFNIQHYAVHDGPGIRTLVFMKGCPLQCRWCCNPESQSLEPQLRYIEFLCKKCLNCVDACPTSSVIYKHGDLIFNYDDCRICESKPCIDSCCFDALSLTGRKISSEELAGIIARDKQFYKNSGGGVTFSGGEPLMQPAFLLDALQKCKDLGIHTAVETCGWATKKVFEDIMPYTDLFLFDLKLIDPALHEEYTGQSNEVVLENLAFLDSQGADIEIRFPVVPGITDTPDNLQAISDVMVKFGLKKIRLEPYHSLGAEKYREHGMEFLLHDIGQYTPAQIHTVSEFFRERGLICDVV